jgi:hypothetical protein
MPRSVLFRLTFSIAIGAATFMAPPAAPATGPSPAHIANLVSSPHVAAGRAWDWLRDLWAKALCVVTPGSSCGSGGVQPDAGCTMDPGGHCIGSAPPAGLQGDAGCGIDPGGHCPGH